MTQSIGLLAALLLGAGPVTAGHDTAAPPSAPLLEVFVVEPTGWTELPCFNYDPDVCTGDEPALRVRYRVIDVLEGKGWSGERTFELNGNVSDYGIETNRTLLIVRPGGSVVAAFPIDPVVGGGWGHCGEPYEFGRDDSALLQPIEFSGVFANVSRLSKYGRTDWDAETYAIEGDVVRCRRGVPAGALLRWVEAGGGQ